MSDEDLTAIRIALQDIAAAHKPFGVPVRQEEIRDEWRRRYAGVALEGLLAGLSLTSRTVAEIETLALRSVPVAVKVADSLLAALDKPAGS